MIDEVLDYTRDHRQLNSQRHAAWQILHGVLAYGPNFEILHDGQSVKTVPWLFSGGRMTGWTVHRGEAGLKAELELGSAKGQGHEDQWLAVLSQCNLASDTKVRVGDTDFTLGDLVSQAMHDVFEGKECSWTLIGLSYFLDPDQEWTARDGQEWTLERIMQMEADQDLNTSACGGSHRLIGMQMALARYREKHPDKPLDGGWKAGHERIQQAIKTAQQFQQPSGSFSINYFARPSDSPDLAAHLGSTGHTLEFLSLSMTDEQLRQPWMVKAVVHLCELFQKTKDLDLECGALYHAAHGLVLYRQRRFGPRDWTKPVGSKDESGESKVETET
jgi:hypothetical protein